jgi:hypothetical protein
VTDRTNESEEQQTIAARAAELATRLLGLAAEGDGTPEKAFVTRVHLDAVAVALDTWAAYSGDGASPP